MLITIWNKINDIALLIFLLGRDVSKLEFPFTSPGLHPTDHEEIYKTKKTKQKNIINLSEQA